MVTKNTPTNSISTKTTTENSVRQLILDVVESTFAVVTADVVPVTADTAKDDAGVNSGTAVGFSEGDTADNIKCCRSRINIDVMVINDVEIKTKRSIPDQNFI